MIGAPTPLHFNLFRRFIILLLASLLHQICGGRQAHHASKDVDVASKRPVENVEFGNRRLFNAYLLFVLVTDPYEQCDRRQDGPCSHCRRRYPPVECILKSGPVLSNSSSAVSSPLDQIASVTGNLRRRASNLGRLTPSRTKPLSSSLPLAQDVLLHDFPSAIGRHLSLVPVSSRESSSSEGTTFVVDLERAHRLIPSTEEKEDAFLIPRKRTNIQHRLPTPTSPMPFGVTSFGGAILADTGVGGPSAERTAQLLHFCMSFEPTKLDSLLTIW
jgi:hypothetical protein